MNATTTRFRHRILPILAAGALLAGCQDDPTVVDAHLEAEGVALYEGTTEIYRHMRDDGTPPPLTLAEGVHDVLFLLLDHDGDPLPEEGHDGDDEEHALQITISNSAILTWMPEDHTDVHDFIEFRGELNALQAGSTTMELCVPHGGHCDFDADVPVTVTAP